LHRTCNMVELTLPWGKPKTMDSLTLPRGGTKNNGSPLHLCICLAWQQRRRVSCMQKLSVEILLESGSCREAGS